MAYRKEQEAIRNQENREEEERLLRLALEQEKTAKAEAAKDDSSDNEPMSKTSAMISNKNTTEKTKVKAFLSVINNNYIKVFFVYIMIKAATDFAISFKFC